MVLKNRVAIYGIIHDKSLTYSEYIDKLNWKHWLFMKVVEEDGNVLYVRLPDEPTFRDVEMFAKGYLFAMPKCTIERKDYVL